MGEMIDACVICLLPSWCLYIAIMVFIKAASNEIIMVIKVKHSRYTPWRRLGGEEV
jgi:hypothetical protein